MKSAYHNNYSISAFLASLNCTVCFIYMLINIIFARHENISGYYRVSVYFLSKILCDVLPQKILPSITFAAISYWMIGLYIYLHSNNNNSSKK